MRPVTPIALSIAGSDPSGGAGIQADLKTFHTHAAMGMAVITLVTVQSTRGVQRVETLSAELVGAQLDALLNDAPPHAIKTGALGSAEIIDVVARRLPLRGIPLVVDPVLASTSGAALVDAAGLAALRDTLLPRATLVTPNLHEAELLLGVEVQDLAAMRDAAVALSKLGPAAVLVKGGHRLGDAVDVLCVDGALYELSEPRIATMHTHGVGCALSAAIAARLSHGATMLDACRGAKEWLTRALRTAPRIGQGRGTINHLEPAQPQGPAHGKLRGEP